MVYQLSFF